jgi:hypothetical protein
MNESNYRELYRLINPKICAYPYPVRFVDTQKKTIGASLTGRAQGAICIYCDRQIAAWGKVAPGKSGNHRRYNIPGVLKDAIVTHCHPCAEQWIWKTLARWSTEIMETDEARAVGKWRRQLEPRAYDLERRILRMFDRLPSPMGTAIADAVDVSIAGIAYEVAQWPDGWTKDPHGTGDNPHVFYLNKAGENVHTCPCGLSAIELTNGNVRLPPGVVRIARTIITDPGVAVHVTGAVDDATKMSLTTVVWHDNPNVGPYDI